MLEALGHIGAWPGLYAVGAFICFAQLSGLEARPAHFAAAALSVFLTATGAYALDRVKLRDAWIDPADASAQPRRYAFLTRHSRAVRTLAFLLLIAGAIAGLAISHWAPLAGACSALGVACYAPTPRGSRPRPKDIVWIKNCYVALGITAFAAMAAIAAASPADAPGAWLDLARAHAPAIAAAAAIVAVRIALDAALCDIDDEPADRAHGTSTLPTTLGPGHTWRLTGIARIFLAAVILACPWVPFHARVVWSILTLVGLIALRTRRPDRLRDIVDLRLAAEGALAAAALLAAPHWFT